MAAILHAPFLGMSAGVGLAPPYDKLGLHQAILDSYREFDYEDRPTGMVHDRD